MYICLHVKYPLVLSDFNKTLTLYRNIFENIELSNFMEIHPVGAELSQADGRTDVELDEQT